MIAHGCEGCEAALVSTCEHPLQAALEAEQGWSWGIDGGLCPDCTQRWFEGTYPERSPEEIGAGL